METVSVADTVDVRQRIKSLIGDSERLFLTFADTFPEFVKEMKRSLERSSSMLGSIGSGSGFENALHALFHSTRSAVSVAAGRFKDMQERDRALLFSLENGIKTLSSLDSIIARIKDDSVEMEIISLNAMTVALKSGSAGKAFSVITDELKRLSARTITLTDRLTEDGKKLLVTFESFRADVEQLEHQQSELFEGLEKRLVEPFSALEAAVRDIGGRMLDLVDRSRSIEPPVRAIMETVQLQDIVRQSLEHVLMALDEMDAVGGSSSDLLFKSRLAELASAMVADVRSQIAGAAATIAEGTEAVSKIVEEGESKRRDLLGETGGMGGAGLAVKAFSRAAETLVSLSSQVDGYLRTKSALASNGGQLSGAVEILDRGFLEFGKILNRFKNIDVASRIEVAKQQSLRSMSDTVVEMSSLTTRIGEDVGEATLSTRGFIAETTTAIEGYTLLAEEEGLLIRESQDSLEESHRGVVRLKDALQQNARDFSLYTTDFLSLLEASKTESLRFGKMIGELQSAERQLAAFKTAADAEIARRGEIAVSAPEELERFRDVIERFTIYAHKQAAADIGGFRVESGVELGEVTLF